MNATVSSATSTLDGIILRNTAFSGFADLVDTMKRDARYHPTMRCERMTGDPEMMRVVEALDELGLGNRCYVYYSSNIRTGAVATCWGVPAKRRDVLAAKAMRVALTARERIELRDLDAALGPRACMVLSFLRGWAAERARVSGPKKALAALDAAVSAHPEQTSPVGAVYRLTMPTGRHVRIAIRRLSEGRAKVTGKDRRVSWLG